MATEKQKKAIKKVIENRGNISKAMRDAGYTEATAKNPKNLTNSKTWNELMDEYLPDDLLAKKHNELLNSTCIDHMVFPLGPDTKEEDKKPPIEFEPQAHGGALKREHKQSENTKLTDEEIIELLANVNCTVKKIVHGEIARHVYFWARDNMAIKNALDLAYKLKGSYAPERKQVDFKNKTTDDLKKEIVDEIADLIK